MDTFKNFIISVGSDENGISESSYELLVDAVKRNKQLAFELHDVLGRFEKFGNRYIFSTVEDGFEL
jgi:hypothetical protein